MITHRMTKTRLYTAYRHMKERCFNPNNKRYKHYGGKGVTICSEWLGENGFMNFYKWSMENGYTDELTIDRIDTNGNYEPSNCRWADYYTQNNNFSRNHYIEIDGEKLTIGEASKKYDIPYNTLNGRIFKGVPPQVAVMKKRFKHGEIKAMIDV